MSSQEKPIIGLLASHDSQSRNRALGKVLDFLVDRHAGALSRYQFAVTRGTFRRVVMGEGSEDYPGAAVSRKTRDFLLEKCGVLRLPCRKHGGVVLMADLIVKRKINTIWAFLAPTTPHWLTPENVALLRLCDHCHVNRLMNEQSVIEWAARRLDVEADRNTQPVPPRFTIGGVSPDKDQAVPLTRQQDRSFAIDWETVHRSLTEGSRRTLALIAHNDMKSRIEDFAIDYQAELGQFDRLITTGTTGRVVQDAAPMLAGKVRRYNSGPKGGDIEIATEMIFKRCSVAVFLVDPLSPHPHSDDIKALFGAAILNDVRLLTNERQARAWMDRIGGNMSEDHVKSYSEYVRPQN